jgi:threonine synthase
VSRCAGCGAEVPGAAWACPRRRPGDDIDHVMVPQRHLEGVLFPPEGDPESNPFVRYRHLLASYQRWLDLGGSDGGFVDLVGQLNEAVANVDGRGFRVTPLRRVDGIGWVKDETGNVAGSHKARHLMGLMLHLLVGERFGDGSTAGKRLAIASCGNAALAAATVARAADRPLDVFVPDTASEVVLARLGDLGAVVRVCARAEGQLGDPSYLAFREAVAAGAVPFSCQGSDNGFTIDGGATLGWELAGQLQAHHADPSRVYVQVGGGALASAVAQGLEDGRTLGVLERLPALMAVQTEGAFPLARAYDRVAAANKDLTYAATHRSQFMWPWESTPQSIAHGILDDETYDWLAVVKAMLATGGHPTVVGETTLEEANRLARKTTGIDVDHTGSAGFAGALQAGDREGLVLFTG